MKIKLMSAMMMATVIIISLVALQSCTDSKGNENIPRNSEPIPVKVMSLEKSVGASAVKASGRLTTDDETILAFKTAGVVRTVFVKEGDFVKKGQLLATLDMSEIDALVSQARFAFEKAQRDFERTQRLYKDSVATLEQLQNSETGLSLAQQQLEAAQFNRSFSAIHARGNGYVLRKFVNAGQVVDIGDPILMTNGAASGKWLLKIGVSDKQWASIQVGNKAQVTVDAFPGKIFKAQVARKSETTDVETGALTVELEVEHENFRFANGMFGTALLSSDTVRSSWSVPYEAVLDANDNEGFVFVTADNKKAIKQPVTIESFDGNTIRISKGLENTTSLIVSGSAYLTDHSPIIVLK